MWWLKILHTADIHGRLTKEKATFISERIQELKSDGLTEVLLFDSGDSLRGSNTIFLPRERTMKLMNQIGYTAMAIGNREFHYIPSCFKLRASGFSFPLLSSNLYLGSRVKPIGPSIQIMIKGVKIKVIGLTPPQYPEGSLWEKVLGWRFTSPQEAIELELKDLSREIKLVILLSHLGSEEDKALSERIWKLFKDHLKRTPLLILGGHSHERFVQLDKSRNLLIAHPGAYAQHLTEVSLRYDEESLGFSIEDVSHIKIGGDR